MRLFSYLLPYTWGYDLLRYYSFSKPGQGSTWNTILPVAQEWLVVAGFALVFTLASRYLLARAEKMAKRQGLHMI